MRADRRRGYVQPQQRRRAASQLDLPFAQVSFAYASAPPSIAAISQIRRALAQIESASVHASLHPVPGPGRHCGSSAVGATDIGAGAIVAHDAVAAHAGGGAAASPSWPS